MFGPFDDCFDFDHDGQLGGMELGAELGFLDEAMKNELKEKLQRCTDEDEIREVLEEAGLDPDDIDIE